MFSYLGAFYLALLIRSCDCQVADLGLTRDELVPVEHPSCAFLETCSSRACPIGHAKSYCSALLYVPCCIFMPVPDPRFTRIHLQTANCRAKSTAADGGRDVQKSRFTLTEVGCLLTTTAVTDMWTYEGMTGMYVVAETRTLAGRSSSQGMVVSCSLRERSQPITRLPRSPRSRSDGVVCGPHLICHDVPR